MLHPKSVLSLLLVTVACLVGRAQVPDAPAKASPIVDLAGIINNDSLVTALNTQLDTLSHQTGNQVVVVTVNDMGGLDPKEFATELGNKWGIGGKNLNNGLVIVIKPKNESGSGQVGFATGYGLEGSFPDVFCKRLQADYMIPHFKENDYAGGIEAAVAEIIPVIQQEYKETQALAGDTAAKKKGGGGGNGWFIIAIIVGVIALFMLLRKRSKPAQPASQATQATQAAEQPQPQAKTGSSAAGAAAVAGAAATGAALAGAAQEPEEEPEEPVEEEEPEKPKEEEKEKTEPYKYGYGGGSFGGGGASTSWD